MGQAATGQVATTAAEVYEAFFLPALFRQWPERVLEAAETAAGERILDVGCGTGVLARHAAALAGDEGRVTGLDPNEGMLAVARRTPGIDWRRGTAEAMPFPDESFDVVASQFAVMFFVDRAQAMREMRRVLRPGGRVAIASWASLEDTPGYAAMVDLLDRLFGPETGDALRAPYALGDTDELGALAAAAFADVEVRRIHGIARFDSIEAWVHTDIRGWTLSDMSDADHTLLLEAARSELARFTHADGSVEFAAPALIATGLAAA